MNQPSLYIGGSWVKGEGPLFSTVDPSSNSALEDILSASKRQVNIAIASAGESFDYWSTLSFEERVEWVRKFHEVLAQEKMNMAALISREMGKPLWESITEVNAMLGKVEISIEAHGKRLSEVHAHTGDVASHIRYKPHGVVAVLGPFNLPGHLPNGHIIPALLAGNTVVYKPSEKTPLVGRFYMELWERAGLPTGVLNLVQGAREVGRALVENENVAGIFFTGSFAVGSAIHKMCAGAPWKILALEMGGNNPLVAHEMGDIKAAAEHVVQSAFITSGQRCVCARRLIVVKGEESAMLLEELKRQVIRIQLGPYTQSPEPFMGPLVDAQAVQKMQELQAKLIEAGGAPILKMNKGLECENLLTPGILKISSGLVDSDEEFFGPLLQWIEVPDFESAVREANRTRYGLSAGLLSDNHSKYEYFFKHIRAGVVNWNRQITGASGRAPFGGVGWSGNHRPSAYFAADYCAFPIASMEKTKLEPMDNLPPGL